MSYILDALRKADSERERGEVPGLHAQPHLPAVGEPTPPGINRKLIWAVAVLAGLLTVTLLVMFWGRSDSAAPTPAADVSPPPLAMSQQSVPTEPIATPHNQTAGQVPPTVMSADTTALPAEPRPQPAAVTPPPGVFPPVNPLAAPQPTPSAAPSASSARAILGAAPQATAPPTKAKAVDEGRIMTVQELPESVRRELPTITIGGAMYSDTPSQRVLIINSQVLHEGDKINPELSLEQIKLKSAVFRFRNYRYVVNY